MSDIKITLEAVSKQFADAIEQSAKVTSDLIEQMKKLDTAVGTVSKRLDSAEKANKDLAESTKKASAEQKEFAKDLTVTAAKLVALYQTAKFAFGIIKSGAESVINSIDQFQRNTIGSAIAITNLADKTLLFGTTWEQAFQRNLAFSKQTFIELERVAARYFASSTDLQLAFNTLAQRGVVLRREELDLLGQLTDTILLLTGGQQSTIQIQEEIRSLLNGSARATAQLSQLVKAFGLDIKEVAAQIRATQSLKPLEPILQGAKAANKEVQKTFQATINALDVQFEQLKRVAGEGFFNTVNKSLTRLTQFLQDNQQAIAKFGAVLGQFFSLALDKVTNFLDSFGKAGGAKEALSTLTHIAAAGIVGFNALVEVLQAVIALLQQIPVVLSGIATLFKEGIFSDAGQAALSKSFKTAADNLKAVFDTFDPRPLEERFNAIVDSFNAAIDAAEARAKNLQSKGTLSPQPVTPPFIESEESKRNTKQLGDQLDSITIRADRATAQLERFKAATISEVNLQALRRDLALLEKGIQLSSEGVVQGFINIDHELSLLIPALNEAFGGLRINQFGQYIDTLDELEASYSAIRDRIIEIGRTQDLRVLTNLQQQISSTGDLFLKFVATSQAQANEIIADTAGKIRAEAQAEFDKRKGDSDQVLEIANRAIEIAKEKLKLVQSLLTPQGKSVVKEAAAASKKEVDDLIAEQARLTASQKQLRAETIGAGIPLDQVSKETLDTINAQGDRLQKLPTLIALATAKYKEQNDLLKLNKGEVEERIKIEQQAVERSLENQFSVRTNELKLQAILEHQLELAKNAADEAERRAKADSDLAIEQRRKDLIENQLRTLQQINSLGAQAQQTAQQGSAFAQQQQRAAAAALPRTELQAQLSSIEQARTQLNLYVAAMLKQVASLTSAREQLQAGLKLDTERLSVVSEKLQQDQFANEEDKRIAQEEAGLLTTRIEATNKAIESAQGYTNELIKQAGVMKQNGEQALETQEHWAKLDFALKSAGQAFDKVVDVFSGALTDAFEGKKTDFVSAFKGIADSLFKDNLKQVFSTLKTNFTNGLESAFKALPISDTMKSQLGPAFMAGFGLIASFVLGQLMGDHGGEATAANPTVGIQSTEQVRGLIGGETQIPIGLVGESLQEALVPTNSILLRIARGVESQMAGLSPAQIENVISRAVTDAIQIQPV